MSCASCITHAQPDTLWTRTFGGALNDEGYSVLQTNDEGFLVVGFTEWFSLGVGGDVWLIKTDANGDTLWTRTIGQEVEPTWQKGFSVDETDDEGYVIVGNMFNVFGSGTIDVWLIKTDANGDTLWTRTFGGSGWDEAVSVQQTTDGGYILAGSSDLVDALLIKTDPNGNPEWIRIFGGPSQDHAKSVQQTSDGGYILAGSTISFGAGSADAWLIKTDANGDTLWTRTFGDCADDYGYSVLQSTDGGYILAGFLGTCIGQSNGEILVVKVDINGNTLWERYIDIHPAYPEIARSIIENRNGGYVIAGFAYSGSTFSDVVIVGTNASGDALWTSVNTGPDWEDGLSVKQTSDGGYVLAGIIGIPGLNDVYLVKWEPSDMVLVLSPNGGENWCSGISQTITWTSSGVDSVVLDYTTDDGGSWSTIVASTPAVSGSYLWIPDVSSTQCKVRVSNVVYPALNDISDGVFFLESSSWMSQSSPTADDLFDVHFSDATTGSAVGAFGAILRTTNSGVTWTKQASGTSLPLRGVYFTSLNTGIAVGRDGMILRTTNGGDVWTTQPSGTTSKLWGISFSDPERGTVVGELGTILITTDGGIGWTSQVSGTTNWLRAVHFLDANTGFAVGDLGTIIRTTDGGTTWVMQSSTVADTLYGVFFTDEDTGTIVGSGGTILRTTDGGGWVTQSSGTTESLLGISFTNADSGTVVGGSGIILRTSDGETWTRDVLCDFAIQLWGVYFTDADTGTAVGNDGTVLRTTPGSTTSVKGQREIQPRRYSLSQNYPNPFNPSTTITYGLPEKAHVCLELFNMLGQSVVVLVNSEQEVGYHSVVFEGRGLSSGVYIYRLSAAWFMQTKRLLLLR